MTFAGDPIGSALSRSIPQRFSRSQYRQTGLSVIRRTSARSASSRYPQYAGVWVWRRLASIRNTAQTR